MNRKNNGKRTRQNRYLFATKWASPTLRGLRPYAGFACYPQGASPPRGLRPLTPRIFSPKKWACSLNGRLRDGHRGSGTGTEAQGRATEAQGRATEVRDGHRGSGAGAEAQGRAQRLRGGRRGSGAGAEAQGRAQRLRGGRTNPKAAGKTMPSKRSGTALLSRLSVQDRNTKPPGSHRSGQPISLGDHRRPRLYPQDGSYPNSRLQSSAKHDTQDV